MSYTLDIGVASVADHSGFLALRTSDGRLIKFSTIDTPAEAAGALLCAACSCDWSGEGVDYHGGPPSRSLQMEVEHTWIQHIYRDVVPMDRQEALQRLNERLRRLGAAPGSDVTLGDIHRDLLAASDMLNHFTTTGTPQWRTKSVPAVSSPGSIARSAASSITALTAIEGITPEQAYQVTAAIAMLLEQLPDALDQAATSIRQQRGTLYHESGRTIDHDGLSYMMQRITTRLDTTAELVHQCAHQLSGIHTQHPDDEY